MADKPRSETPVTVEVDASGPAPADEGLWGGRIRPGEEVGRGTSAAIVRGNDTTLRRVGWPTS